MIVISAWTTSDKKPGAVTHPKTPLAPRVVPALLSVTALRGSTHLTARAVSATGAVKYDGTVQQGDNTVAIRGKQLWVTIDSPENVRIEVRGKKVHVPGLRPQVIIVTATGWRPARG